MLNFHSKPLLFTNIFSKKIIQKICFLFYRRYVNFLLVSLKWMTTIDKCIFSNWCCNKAIRTICDKQFCNMNNEEYTFILYCFSTVSQLNKEGINPSVVIVITTHGHFLTVQWSGQLLSKLSQYNIKVNSWKFSLKLRKESIMINLREKYRNILFHSMLDVYWIKQKRNLTLILCPADLAITFYVWEERWGGCNISP